MQDKQLLCPQLQQLNIARGRTKGRMNYTKIDNTVSWQNPSLEIGAMTQSDSLPPMVMQCSRGVSASINTLIVIALKVSRNSYGKVLFDCLSSRKAELSYNLLN
jgi:hypothetical protein